MSSNETSGSSSSVHITVIVQKRCTLNTGTVTGSWIKQVAGIPADFTLHRRVKGGNEHISDDAPIRMRDGDHFFARAQALMGAADRSGPGVRGLSTNALVKKDRTLTDDTER
jgi:hypothetical protein